MPVVAEVAVKAEEIAEQLPAALCAALHAERVAIDPNSVRRLAGGAVHETWAVDAVIELPGQPSEARRAMTSQLGRALAAIHRIPVTPELRSFLRAPEPGVPAARTELARLEETYRGITPDPHPAFELGLRWLAKRLPESGEPTFV